MRVLLVTVLAAAGLAFAAPALAQRGAPPEQGEGWYRQQLVDLAEVLGGSHYLRITCSGRSDQRWRDYMRGVMDREPSMSDALRDAFNDGYRTEATRFPECNSASQQTEAELRARGMRIASALSAQNGQ
ncbi:MAG: TIGR02301 family protein [Caulobacterales bacterium]